MFFIKVRVRQGYSEPRLEILGQQIRNIGYIHCKNSFSIFPSPAGMSLTKLSLGGNSLYMTSLFPPRESLVSDIPAGDGNIKKLFLRCSIKL
jgi:hypothetical protein